jgi:hypothetical protein
MTDAHTNNNNNNDINKAQKGERRSNAKCALQLTAIYAQLAGDGYVKVRDWRARTATMLSY